MNGAVLLLAWATMAALGIAYILYTPTTQALIAKLNQTRKDNPHA